MTRTTLAILAVALMITVKANAQQNPFLEGAKDGMAAWRAQLPQRLAAAEEWRKHLSELTVHADRGDVRAQVRLGFLHYRPPRGFEQLFGDGAYRGFMTVYWWTKAVKQRHAVAKTALVSSIRVYELRPRAARKTLKRWGAIVDVVRHTDLDYQRDVREAFTFFSLLKAEGFNVGREIDLARAQMTKDEIKDAQGTISVLRSEMKARKARSR